MKLWNNVVTGTTHTHALVTALTHTNTRARERARARNQRGDVCTDPVYAGALNGNRWWEKCAAHTIALVGRAQARRCWALGTKGVCSPGWAGFDKLIRGVCVRAARTYTHTHTQQPNGKLAAIRERAFIQILMINFGFPLAHARTFRRVDTSTGPVCERAPVRLASTINEFPLASAGKFVGYVIAYRTREMREYPKCCACKSGVRVFFRKTPHFAACPGRRQSNSLHARHARARPHPQKQRTHTHTH